ncbi:MAG: hypothetical protein RIB60_06205 [Phycisphaerales bacterium]
MTSTQLIVGVLGLVLVGAVLIAIGWRGRRVNTNPVCGDCSFDLSDVLPGGVTCPECGAGLRRAEGVRQGLRKKRAIVLALGLVLAGLPLAAVGLAVGGSAVGVDWSRHKPVWLLAWEAERGGAAAVEVLARELARRDIDGTFSGADIERAGEVILALQRTPGAAWDDRLGDFIEQQTIRKALGDEVKRAFDLHAVRFTMTGRRRAVPGGQLVLQPEIERVCAGSGTQLNGMLSLVHVALGEKTVHRSSHAGGGWANQFGGVHVYRNPMWGGGGNEQVYGTAKVSLPYNIDPGAYDVSYTVRFALQPTEMVRGAAAPPQADFEAYAAEHRRDFEGSLRVTVLPEGSEVIDLVPPDADTTEEIERVLDARTQAWVHEFSSMGTTMQLSVPDTSALPHPIAGWATAEWNGKTWRAAPVVLRAKDPGSRGVSIRFNSEWDRTLPEGFDAEEIDFVIVPDPELAMGTTDIDRIYGGPVTLRDVRIEWGDLKPGRTSKPSGGWAFLRGIMNFDEEDAAEMTRRLEAIKAQQEGAAGEDGARPDG